MTGQWTRVRSGQSKVGGVYCSVILPPGVVALWERSSAGGRLKTGEIIQYADGSFSVAVALFSRERGIYLSEPRRCKSLDEALAFHAP